MKNIWLHSAVIVLLGSIALAVSQYLVLISESDTVGLAKLSAPLQAFATLAPSLALGWFTRRHPLLVGGVASVLASFWAVVFFGTDLPAAMVIASAMYAAVAALAGRALRYRFSPE